MQEWKTAITTAVPGKAGSDAADGIEALFRLYREQDLTTIAYTIGELKFMASSLIGKLTEPLATCYDTITGSLNMPGETTSEEKDITYGKGTTDNIESFAASTSGDSGFTPDSRTRRSGNDTESGTIGTNRKTSDRVDLDAIRRSGKTAFAVGEGIVEQLTLENLE